LSFNCRLSRDVHIKKKFLHKKHKSSKIIYANLKQGLERMIKEAKARIKINKLLEDAGWRFLDSAERTANAQNPLIYFDI